MKEIIALKFIPILWFITNTQSVALMHQTLASMAPPTGKGEVSRAKVRGNYFFAVSAVL